MDAPMLEHQESSEILLVETSSFQKTGSPIWYADNQFQDIRITQHYAIEVTQICSTAMHIATWKTCEKLQRHRGYFLHPSLTRSTGTSVARPILRYAPSVLYLYAIRLEKGLFIDCTIFPDTSGSPCRKTPYAPDATVHSLIQLKEMGYSPHMIDSQMGVSHWNLTRCIDCRSKGGIPQVPVFWPVEWPWF